MTFACIKGVIRVGAGVLHQEEEFYKTENVADVIYEDPSFKAEAR